MPTTWHNAYSILSGEDYSLIKPTTLFCITNQKLLPNATEEFYSKYRLTNLKSHDLYTDKFGINVLQLDHIDIATEEDIIASRDATIADNKATIASRDATIADKNLEIETLKAKLKEYEQSKK